MTTRFTHIVGTCALIAYFKGEDGHERFAGILKDERNVLAIHAVNLFEVYCDYLRADGYEVAEEAWGRATTILAVVQKADEDFMKRVARWKVEHELGLGDAFAATTAEEYACHLVLADRNDFSAIEQAGTLQIVWLR